MDEQSWVVEEYLLLVKYLLLVEEDLLLTRTRRRSCRSAKRSSSSGRSSPSMSRRSTLFACEACRRRLLGVKNYFLRVRLAAGAFFCWKMYLFDKSCHFVAWLTVYQATFTSIMPSCHSCVIVCEKDHPFVEEYLLLEKDLLLVEEDLLLTRTRRRSCRSAKRSSSSPSISRRSSSRRKIFSW